MQKKFVKRQGDVLIFKIEDAPQMEMKKGKPILAYGEAHNHTHAIMDEVDYVELDEATYGLEGIMEIKEQTYLRHGTPTKEKHAKIELPPGTYGWIIQREWSEGEERKVRD